MTNNQDWQTRFDEEFVMFDHSNGRPSDQVLNSAQAIKAFITSLLAVAEARGAERAVDYIDKHYGAKAPAETANKDFNELTKVLEKARTITQLTSK